MKMWSKFFLLFVVLVFNNYQQGVASLFVGVLRVSAKNIATDEIEQVRIVATLAHPETALFQKFWNSYITTTVPLGNAEVRIWYPVYSADSVRELLIADYKWFNDFALRAITSAMSNNQDISLLNQIIQELNDCQDDISSYEIDHFKHLLGESLAVVSDGDYLIEAYAFIHS
ncbi:hypothetical protein FJ365_01530 [Candidatus Dependentiae bacterium]|nr:hypothetical protein [Candidatus Dependentiae bacterium]